jgi:hypothetical protein
MGACKKPVCKETGCTKVQMRGMVSQAVVEHAGAQFGYMLIRNTLGHLSRLALLRFVIYTSYRQQKRRPHQASFKGLLFHLALEVWKRKFLRAKYQFQQPRLFFTVSNGFILNRIPALRISS